MTPKQIAHFWAKVHKTDACWLWQGTCHKNGGHGKVKLGRAMRYTHRVSYELANGLIPVGMCVCHTCDTPSCVNPAHLYLGTNKQNVGDRVTRGRSWGWMGGYKLSKDQVREIRVRGADGQVSCSALAKEYRCSRSQIQRILRYQTRTREGC